MTVYKVWFADDTRKMRTNIIKTIDNTEVFCMGDYDIITTQESDAVEYELNKAKRKDNGECDWEIISKN